MPNSRSRWFTASRLAAAALVPLVAGATAACSGGGSSSDNSAGGSASTNNNATLTVQFAGPPIAGLDPSHEAGGQSVIYTSLAYDPLIFEQPDGTLVPDLATAWKYTDNQNKVLQLTIRKNVKFSDGQELTPDGVVQWLNYFKNGNSIRSYELADMASATASGDTVTITLSNPNPQLPLLLTQTYGAGFVASPAAMNNKGSMDAATDGAGAFKLDPSQTVTGDHYTYVRNPDYWNPSVVHFGKVVVKAIGDPNTVLSSVESGQVNVAIGSGSTVATAKSAGLAVTDAGSNNVIAMYLLDRSGTSVKALGDQRVRQAINYAIDRAGIVKALNPNGYATPTSQSLLPEQPGYKKSNDSYYGYNPSKAKQLLSQAGYGSGFTFTGMCFTALGTCPAAQAVASSLSKVGITMNVDQETQPATFNQKFGSGTVPAVFFGMGDTTFLSAQQWLPTNSFQNSYKSTDDQLTSAYNELAAAQSESASDSAATKLVSRVLDLAWFAPVERLDTVYYVKGVSNTKWTAAAPGYYSPTDPTGKYSWRMSQ